MTDNAGVPLAGSSKVRRKPKFPGPTGEAREKRTAAAGPSVSSRRFAFDIAVPTLPERSLPCQAKAPVPASVSAVTVRVARQRVAVTASKESGEGWPPWGVKVMSGGSRRGSESESVGR